MYWGSTTLRAGRLPSLQHEAMCRQIAQSRSLVILRCEGGAVPVRPLPGQLVYLVRHDRLVRLEVVDDLGPALGAVPDLGGPRAPANTR